MKAETLLLFIKIPKISTVICKENVDFFGKLHPWSEHHDLVGEAWGFQGCGAESCSGHVIQ